MNLHPTYFPLYGDASQIYQSMPYDTINYANASIFLKKKENASTYQTVYCNSTREFTFQAMMFLENRYRH
jgi:hypothetical protein